MRLMLAIGLAAAAYFYAQHHDIAWNPAGGGPMDGTVWDIRVKPDSWFSFSHKDTLLFDSGRVAQVRLMAAGYRAGSYSATGSPGRFSWQASSQSGDNLTLEWTGQVQGDRIEGQIVQHAADGRVRQLRFKGTRKLS